MTTGEGIAPYSQSADAFWPGIELSLFVLFDEEASDITRISEGLRMVGRFGFGKDASRDGVGLILPGWKKNLGAANFGQMPATPWGRRYPNGDFSARVFSRLLPATADMEI